MLVQIVSVFPPGEADADAGVGKTKSEVNAPQRSRQAILFTVF